jgi:hypothetical protein
MNQKPKLKIESIEELARFISRIESLSEALEEASKNAPLAQRAFADGLGSAAVAIKESLAGKTPWPLKSGASYLYYLDWDEPDDDDWGRYDRNDNECATCGGDGLVSFTDEEWISRYGVPRSHYQFTGQEEETMKRCPDCLGKGG